MKNIPILLCKEVNIGPQQQVLLECFLDEYTDQLANCKGLVFHNKDLEENANIVIALTSSLSKLDNDNRIYISSINLYDSQITRNSEKQIAPFKNLRESQADYLLEIDPQILTLAKMRKPDNFENELNQLIQDIHFQKFDTDNGRPPPDYSKLWFPTPETCTDLSNMSPLQREDYDQILQLQRCEKKPKN